MNEREAMSMRILDSITNIMDFQETNDGGRLWWCFCFGDMLQYIADKTFGLDYDIDIGVLYEECDYKRLIAAFEGIGYKAKITCIHDVDEKPLNIHFKPIEDYIKDTPTLDVYFWYPVGELLYHTYDTKREGSKRPSEYVFKGVKREWLAPDRDVVEAERKVGQPGREQLLTDRGTWKFPIFDEASSLTMRLPFKIGHVLDEFYGPSWRFREYYKGQSRTRWVKKVKSCKELH